MGTAYCDSSIDKENDSKYKAEHQIRRRPSALSGYAAASRTCGRLGRQGDYRHMKKSLLGAYHPLESMNSSTISVCYSGCRNRVNIPFIDTYIYVRIAMTQA